MGGSLLRQHAELEPSGQGLEEEGGCGCGYQNDRRMFLRHLYQLRVPQHNRRGSPAGFSWSKGQRVGRSLLRQHARQEPSGRGLEEKGVAAAGTLMTERCF